MQISRVVLGIGINGVVDNTEENIGWYKKNVKWRTVSNFQTAWYESVKI
jgi:hypothetical protein